MITKLFLTLTGLVAIVVLSIGIYLNTTPDFPPTAAEVIAASINSEVPELITGKTGIATSSGVEIWYESMSKVDKPRGTIVLSMGASATALFWPKHFYQPLLDAGYRVVRYDHRGLGMSDWVLTWQPDFAYTLEDMALDVIAVLDAIKVEKAHIIGISMGGMIGQRLAISHSDRILSLASISSSGYLDDPEFAAQTTSLNIDLLSLFLKYGLFPSEKNQVRMGVGLSYLVKGDGDYEPNVREMSQAVLYEIRCRQGLNDKVLDQHKAAISESGSRYDELRSITVPTLVVHGASDPIIPIGHAKKYADIIKGAGTLWLKGMGHDLPKRYMDKIIVAILSNIERAKSS